MNDESLLEYPTEFPIKALGRKHPDFRKCVLEVIAVHAQFDSKADVREQTSSNGNFISVTVTFTAENQEQVDAVYRSLHGHELVLMVF
ncbi:MAG: DUF493 domain-containing protein [Gammaproteobacteria bacterium]|jgi:hypothetical protein|nr:DUF493 domain-containing protein [Gammaproteobacteria bacterium]MDP6616191.1 DUF493 domain-containing protein [Gammaproteobacteria bacterium]MDP6695601.1 DUF493 domain-containing protein [Gammaproteobacteria bacterium]MDP7041714.1 DUF493 domain-containing protein [Gammaproteobacteria bacterium]